MKHWACCYSSSERVGSTMGTVRPVERGKTYGYNILNTHSVQESTGKYGSLQETQLNLETYHETNGSTILYR